MEKFLNNTKKFIFHKQKDILSSAIILSSMIILSRIFGLVRYRTLATFFTKEELDIFFAAFRIPDFVFEIIITGALSSAFIPIFIKYQKDQEKLHKNISSIINFIMLILFFFVVITLLLIDWVIPIITPGFSQEKVRIITSISRIILVGQLPFLVAGNLLSGIAQANMVFIISAVAPVIYNVGIIIGTIILSKQFYLYGPVWGVVFGAVAFFIIQIPIIYSVKFKYFFSSFNKDVVREFVTLFIPRMLSVLATQIDLTIDLTLSTLIGPGNYTVFFFAQHLQLLPVSFIGMSFGQASLPYLSNLFKNKQIAEIKKIFVDSILQLLYLSIPLSLFFIFARTPIVRIIFGGRKFDWAGTNMTAVTSSIFALSIPMHTIFYFLVRSFYADHDTKTPFKINSLTIFINTVLSLWFVLVLKLPVWSLAISFSFAISINILLLLFAFYRKINGFNIKKLINNSVKIYIISFISSIIPYITLKILDPLVINTSRTFNLIILVGIVFAIYSAIYIFLSWIFTVEEVYLLTKILVKIKEAKKRLEELYIETG